MTDEDGPSPRDRATEQQPRSRTESGQNASQRNASTVEPTTDTVSPASAGGASRSIDTRRVLSFFLIGVFVFGGIGGVVMSGVGLDSLPSVGECDPGAPNAEFVVYQSAGADGERLALQLEEKTDVSHVYVMANEQRQTNMSYVGETTTITGLSSGTAIEYVGFTNCGQQTVGTYTVS